VCARACKSACTCDVHACDVRARVQCACMLCESLCVYVSLARLCAWSPAPPVSWTCKGIMKAAHDQALVAYLCNLASATAILFKESLNVKLWHRTSS